MVNSINTLNLLNDMKHLITLVWIVLCASTFAQDGYFGNKNVFGVSVFGNNPRLNGQYKNTLYRYQSNELKETKEYFNYGASIYYMRNMTNRFSMGVEWNTRVFNAPSPRFDTVQFGPNASFIQSDTLFLKMEALQFLSRGAQLRFEFHTKNGIGPIGFTHVAGLGYSETQLKKTHYRYTLNEVGANAPAYESELDVYNFNTPWPKFRSITTQYGLHMRYPLTKYLALDAGVKILMNIFIKPSEESFVTVQSDPFNYRISYFDVQRKNFISVSAKAGIVYLF